MSEEFHRELAEAVRRLDAADGMPHTLEELVDLAPEFFPAADHVGVSLVERGTMRTPAASHERLRELDEWQYELGEGPCREAIRQHCTVRVDDLATDPRWPAWGAAMAEELGIRSSLSFRLFTRPDDTWGALNVYSRTPRAFSEDDVVHGQVVAAMAAVALARSLNDEQLTRALESRTVIGQATGIIMERYGLDDQRAFEVLRRLSSHDNIKLRDLAVRVVTDHPLEGGSGTRRV
jgi:GAF domain-containing protein